jgi:hypothetical protein
MASEHILLTKEQFERLKNKRDVIDKNTTATQTHHEEEISLQPWSPSIHRSKEMQEYANEQEAKDDEKINAINSKTISPTEMALKMNQMVKENETNKGVGRKIACAKVSRKTIGQKRAPISKKLVNSKILKKDKKIKNSGSKVIAWHHF